MNDTTTNSAHLLDRLATPDVGVRLAGKDRGRNANFRRLFAWYSRYYLSKHFNALRLLKGVGTECSADVPLVVYLNHASWWDPIVAALLWREFFVDRTPLVPIDAAALDRYRFFAKLGFFGVERGTLKGARAFHQKASEVLTDPSKLLLITPQGRFCDIRERPVRFEAGMGHLAKNGIPCNYLPIAIEYIFWQERLPEVLINMAAPLRLGANEAAACSGKELNTRLEDALSKAQNDLSQAAIAQRADQFQTLIKGQSGVGMVYDAWRWFGARLRGKPFNPQHQIA